MTIREITAQDLDSVLCLYRHLNPRDPAPDQEKARAICAEIIESKRLHLFILERSPGVIVSSCYLNIMPNLTRCGAPYAVIENVVTDEGERNKGFGKSVVSFAVQWAWKSGCYKVMLLTGSKKQSTHDFYVSCGFTGNDKTGYVARPLDVTNV